MNMSTNKRNRNRAAYNRAFKEARESYWLTDQKESWDEYRVRFIQQAMANNTGAPRGRRVSDNQTPRQRYQQVYQRARRQAESAYYKSAQLKAQFKEFPEYWQARKHTWLPEGFMKDQDKLVPKRQTNAKDTRSAYQMVYKDHRRYWENNIGECNQRFNYSWERYWAVKKANIFYGKDDEPIADVVTLVNPGSSGPQTGQHFSRLPKDWFPAPITRPAPVAVYLDTDTIEDNSDWLIAA
jgi:hypothetical protein